MAESSGKVFGFSADPSGCWTGPGPPIPAYQTEARLPGIPGYNVRFWYSRDKKGEILRLCIPCKTYKHTNTRAKPGNSELPHAHWPNSLPRRQILH
jgi:hypothetical protein